ncbi:hypothetical protein JB92DRAFT_2831852 [Gautieria morchelliformis]|nr:hypothetical protein JB92DRAFT_2831852 [Gautieria morchelliformis]
MPTRLFWMEATSKASVLSLMRKGDVVLGNGLSPPAAVSVKPSDYFDLIVGTGTTVSVPVARASLHTLWSLAHVQTPVSRLTSSDPSLVLEDLRQTYANAFLSFLQDTHQAHNHALGEYRGSPLRQQVENFKYGNVADEVSRGGMDRLFNLNPVPQHSAVYRGTWWASPLLQNEFYTPDVQVLCEN